MRIILFGDSITAGYKEDFVSTALTQRLKQYFPNDEIINAGVPGNTTEDGRGRFDRNVGKYHPDVVVIFFGANDVSTNHLVTKSRYEENLRWMIERVGREKVVLVTPPFVNEVLQTSRKMSDIHDYGECVKKMGEELAVPVIPLLDEMLTVSEPKIYLQGDGLHFSEAGYDLLAELYQETIQRKRGESK